MVNAFNSMSRKGHILKTSCTGEDIIQFIPFVRVFYAFEYLLFYSHYNHEGDVMIILFAMGIR
jgi:hypothetical protein